MGHKLYTLGVKAKQLLIILLQKTG